MTTAQLPDASTLTYDLVESANPNLSSPTSVTTMCVQTGAGGVGAPAAMGCAIPKFAGGKYMGLRITASASANAAGVAVPLQTAMTAAT
jgi:hypothetical protein